MKKFFFLIPVFSLIALVSNAQVKGGAVTLPESFSYKLFKISDYKITGKKFIKNDPLNNKILNS
jgi:hypothetical protein